MFSGCVGEAVVELLVDVSLDGGDLLLLSGLETTSAALVVREHQSSGSRDAEAAIFSFTRFTAWLHEVRTSVLGGL